VTQVDELEEHEIKIGCFPLLKASQPEERIEHKTRPNLVPDTPQFMQQSLDTPVPDSC